MQINNGRLGYTLTLDNKQVQQILAQTRADFARTSEYAISEVNKVQNKMNSIAVLGGSFLSIAAAKGFVTELIHVRGEFQQIENAIETITGSQDKMNTLMTEWKDLTLRSPFRLSEIAQSGKQLLAYGVEVEKVTDDIEMLGNIASGVSAPINDIAYLYGTLKTQGRAYQQDINQFTGRGIPIIKELAKQFGVAESEVRAMTEAGKIGFPEVEKALRAMTSEGGQFFNLIGKQATTLTGAVNRLKHEIELMFNEIVTESEGLLSGGINVVTHLVENYQTLGKTLGVLITTYGAYKAAVMVTNTIEQIRYTTTLALGAAEGRVTTIQGLRYLATLKLTAAQTALNAVMMANPYAIIIAGAVALGTAYYLLSDNTTSAQRAQEAYNKTQEEVKSKLDETKKKADEYINTLKDETATVYQQIQAYNALQALKLKGLENLTQEQIATMDLTELRKLLNASYDDQSLKAQENELKRLDNEIKAKRKELSDQGALGKQLIENGGSKELEDLNNQYKIQLESINKIKTDQQLANLPLRDRAKYWEDEIKKIEDSIAENERLNFGVKSTNPLIKDNTDAANIFKVALQSANISPLLGQLEEAKKQFSAVTSEMSGGIVNKSLSDYNYFDFENLRKKLEDQIKNTPKSEQNTEKYKNLFDLIRKVNKEIDTYDSKEKKPKKTKTPKKSDDPVEIFKKQVQGMKDEYDRYVNYMNSDDIVLKATAEAISLRIKNKGANYEEYLRNVQKELANVTNKTKVQVKELQYVNDELAKIIDYNAFDKYKEGINEQVDSSENLLKVIGLLEEEKQKFANSTDQIDKDKFKFLDEKEIDVIKKLMMLRSR
ncbi:tape measure protein [Chishuiella changwenlii]|uniref:tape measure protein n=1 Tax=Chishuiella changwenlii TaxID=1434701 RepID=UPI002FD903E5